MGALFWFFVWSPTTPCYVGTHPCRQAGLGLDYPTFVRSFGDESMIALLVRMWLRLNWSGIALFVIWFKPSNQKWINCDYLSKKRVSMTVYMIISPSMAEKKHTLPAFPFLQILCPFVVDESPIHAFFTKSCNHQAAISQFPIGYIPNSTKNIRNPEIPNNSHFNVGCSQHFEARSLIPWGEDSAPPLPRRADAAVPAPNGPPATPRRVLSAWGSTGRGRKGLPGRCQRSHAAPVGPYQKSRFKQEKSDRTWSENWTCAFFLVMWKALKEEVLDRCQIFLKT